jgi:hypothetical protein
MASGNPSNRAQISAMAGAFAAVTRKSDRAALACSTKRATAAYCVSRSSGGSTMHGAGAAGALGTVATDDALGGIVRASGLTRFCRILETH